VEMCCGRKRMCQYTSAYVSIHQHMSANICLTFLGCSAGGLRKCGCATSVFVLGTSRASKLSTCSAMQVCCGWKRICMLQHSIRQHTSAYVSEYMPAFCGLLRKWAAAATFLRQYLYFCTSKASKVSACGRKRRGHNILLLPSLSCPRPRSVLWPQ
jgi:hypothetical protein